MLMTTGQGKRELGLNLMCLGLSSDMGNTERATPCAREILLRRGGVVQVE